MPYPGKSKDEVVKIVMDRYKKGEQHAGDSKHLATSNKQAIAIALSEAKKYGNK